MFVVRPPVRVLALGLSALLALPAVASAQLPGYAPSTSKYRVDTELKITQSAMGQTIDVTNTTKQVVSVNIAGRSPALDLTMVLDSVTATSTGPQEMPDNSKLIGLKITGKLSPAGAVSEEKAVDKTGAEPAGPIAQTLKSLLPRLQPGAKVGDTWKDSTTTTADQGGIKVTTTTLTTYKYDGDSTVAGTKFAKVSALANAKIGGKGNAQGQDLSLEGTSKSSSVFLVTPAGVFHGGQSLVEADLNITLEAMGMVIPMTQKGINKIERAL